MYMASAHAQHMHSTAQHMMHTVHNMNWSRMLCLSVQNSVGGGISHGLEIC